MAKIRGKRELSIKLGRIGPASLLAAREALRRGALAIENRAVEGIVDPPKTGRWYRSKHKKGALHRASKPGEFPAADSGRLHQSITSVETSTQEAVRFETGSNVPYGPMLEFGTSKMEPRPFMTPAFNENVDAIKANVRAAIKRGVRKGSR